MVVPECSAAVQCSYAVAAEIQLGYLAIYKMMSMLVLA